MASERAVDFFGVRYVIPTLAHHQGTMIAINLGGAVIPTCISLYLCSVPGLWARRLALPFVSAISCTILLALFRELVLPFRSSFPPLLPRQRLLLGHRTSASTRLYCARLAVSSRRLADITKLAGLGDANCLHRRGRPFDGIFFTGIIAVLLT